MNDYNSALCGIEQWFDGANQVSDEIEKIRFSIEMYCISRNGSASKKFEDNERLEITARLVAVGLQIDRLKQQKEQVLGVLHFKCFAKIGFFIQGHKRWKYAIDVLGIAHKETEKAWAKILNYLDSRKSPSWGTEEFEIAFFVDHIGNGWSIPPHTWFGVGRDAHHNVNERLLSELNQVIVELNAGGFTLSKIDTQNPQNTPGNKIPKPEIDTQNPQNKDGLYREQKRFVWDGESYNDLSETMMNILDVLHKNYPNKTFEEEFENKIGTIQSGGFWKWFRVNRGEFCGDHPVKKIVRGRINTGIYLKLKQ